MLSFGDQTNEKDPLLLQEALSQATAYLTSNGYAAIDPAQVVARGLGVDLAVVIDARMFCETRGRNYYAQATITAHIFEAATGHLEGVQSFNGPETLSKVDEADAVCNALLSGVCALMQLVVQQPKNLLSAPAHGGI